MCGFSGSFNGDAGPTRSMAGLDHRGPDSCSEIYEKGLYIRYYRLAILGEEHLARQPMLSFDKRVIIAFNGEIYNYKELAGAMGKPELISHGDTRVLTEFIAQYGLDRINELNGMFAAVVYFKNENRLYLIRDRFGIKPLYYFTDGKAFYFASEIKCFKRLCGMSMNRQRLIDYMDKAEYPCGESTFFDRIYQVAPGTIISLENYRLTKQEFYNFRDHCKALSNRELTVDGYEDLLAASIKLRLRSDVPVSIHYSGGTDSTALLLKTKEIWGDDYPLTAFSMAFEEMDYDESHLASAYCKQHNVKHVKVFLQASEVPSLACELHSFQDEPYGGIPTIAYYKLNKAERDNNFIVSIEGQGGDETFGGYLSHAYMAMYDLHCSGNEHELLKCLLEYHQTDIGTVITKSEQLLLSGFKSHTDLTDLRIQKKAELPEKFIDWLKTIQLNDIISNKIPRTLRFNDRASMACGREIRFPLLDHNLVAYGVMFSHAVKYSKGLNKAPLRAIIKRHSNHIYRIPKRSVVTPQTQWFKNELKDWVLSRIDVVKKAHMLPESYFSKAHAFFNKTPDDNSFYIWQLINLSYFVENV